MSLDNKEYCTCYPEYADNDFKEYDKYDIIDISKGTYEEDFKEADKIAKEKDGRVYTIIDAEGSNVIYSRGRHMCNRIGVCVFVKVKE